MLVQLQALSLIQKTVQIRDQFFLYMDPGGQWPFYRWHPSLQTAAAAGIPDINVLCFYSSPGTCYCWVPDELLVLAPASNLGFRDARVPLLLFSILTSVSLLLLGYPCYCSCGRPLLFVTAFLAGVAVDPSLAGFNAVLTCLLSLVSLLLLSCFVSCVLLLLACQLSLKSLLQLSHWYGLSDASAGVKFLSAFRSY